MYYICSCSLATQFHWLDSCTTIFCNSTLISFPKMSFSLSLYQNPMIKSPAYLQDKENFQCSSLLFYFGFKFPLSKVYGCCEQTISIQFKYHFYNFEICNLKGPSQSHLCFCLHARIWLLYFIRSMSKRRKIMVKLLMIINHTFRNTTYSKIIRTRFTMLHQ